MTGRGYKAKMMDRRTARPDLGFPEIRFWKVQKSKISIRLRFTEDSRMVLLDTPPARNDLSRRCSRPLRPPADLAATSLCKDTKVWCTVYRAKSRFQVSNLTTDSGSPEIENFDSSQIHSGLAYDVASHSPGPKRSPAAKVSLPKIVSGRGSF